MSEPERKWWKEAVVYQIYPISFFDSNGDGIGDLNGIASKLDYLKDLGVDVLWLSPIYKSPLADYGYDISDYRSIDPRYGTLEDWDSLLKGVHDRGMKLMMDLVVNHTSDEHEWFQQSISGKDNPKRDWYIWRPPKVGEDGSRQPPNNWRSVFQGSAWEYDEKSNEYYLHLYVTKQPDLNWDNPEVREAVWDVMRFWIDRGCDGFRMDVINLVSKVPGLPDASITEPGERYQPAAEFYANGPKVHEYIQQMHREVLSKHDLITVGEAPFSYDESALGKYVLPANKELQMIFQFELVDVDSPKGPDRSSLMPRPWKLTELKGIINKWQTYKRHEGFWNAVYIENHDQARSVSRFGNDTTDEKRTLSAKMLAVMQATQSGTLYVYQGEELGLHNFPRSWGLEEYKDVATQNFYNRVLENRRREQGREDVDMSDVLDGLQKKARDHARTPVQWNSSPHGGFTTGKPWMRVNDDYPSWNAEKQISDPGSVRSFWKKLLELRKEKAVLIYGDFKLLLADSEDVFAYQRSLGNSRAFVYLNFRDKDVQTSLPSDVGSHFEYGLGNYADGNQSLDRFVLRPYEARVYFSADT
ncbi:glycoside hydrolase family 13 protein [Schizophyllum commune H4-8]|uniref:Glycoside hydrolase family 13 protein n=1 Tax=Schizophyllum commune (strain H4-8 / FGSC 9210) TaxID=578458 RepID=D8QFN0_SCHCM|nr:glycoside hydrolase family 13 protein [Schizophyllum commune H4-8]KAI5887710.1 glycoside hydrolase family 13 protein [Schizophyllum commune H4-8]